MMCIFNMLLVYATDELAATCALWFVYLSVLAVLFLCICETYSCRYSLNPLVSFWFLIIILWDLFGLNFIHVAQNSWLTPRLHMTFVTGRLFHGPSYLGAFGCLTLFLGPKISSQLVIKGFSFTMKSVGEIVQPVTIHFFRPTHGVVKRVVL